MCKYLGILTLFFLLINPFATFAGQDLDYSVNGVAYQGYLVNSGKNAPTILLLHDWDGLTDYERKRSEMLGEMGYSVFAADLFGKGIRPTTVTDKRQHTGELYKDRQKLRAIMRGALAAAMEQGLNGDQVVAMGYCFGGAAVLELARAGEPLTGFVTFHGGLGTPAGQDYSQAKGSYLIFHGSADSNITLEQFSSLAAALEDNGLDHELITYGGAPHAFTVFGAKSYREEADRRSWRRFGEWLKDAF